ncbi:heavy metal-associated isoprenylated plant protein 7 [Prosopis cineraria]|uniref:heavy metal-associated isoprenylated plant protein 7 n=1 Tax=Prosopis cineraria TaxID=364024 RepID=UPI00240F7B5B|nr:heavy metal-associated isoprenylated plant protein 7 [Prosopis cineraria]
MGEDKKKSGEQKTEEKKPEAKEEAKKPENQAEDKKDQKKPEESKDKTPPPPEIVLKVFMHCEGCARKVRRCLKRFPGVEEVITDCKSHKVVVRGEKADPQKVLERVQRKSHRQVELISPIPKPPTEEEKKPEEKEKPAPEEKKEEPQIITVILKVHMHCEACAEEIKRRIQKMKGVESAEPDLKKSEVSVKGVFDPAKLVEFVSKRMGKQAVIVKQEAAEKKEKAEESKEEEEKKAEEGGRGEKEKKEGKGKGEEKKEEEERKGAGEGEAAAEKAEEEAVTEETKVVEMKKSEYQYYPPRYIMEMYAYPPQIFSDENPNACSVM